MATLTKKQDELYTEMVKQYNNSGLTNLCSLDSFLNAKLEKLAFTDRKKWAELYAVVQYAENDY